MIRYRQNTSSTETPRRPATREGAAAVENAVKAISAADVQEPLVSETQGSEATESPAMSVIPSPEILQLTAPQSPKPKSGKPAQRKAKAGLKARGAESALPLLVGIEG